MRKRHFKKVIHSVFFRLLMAIVVVAIALTIISLTIFLILRNSMREPLGNNLIRYARYMADDMGVPPDRQKALAIADDTQMAIRYKGPAQSWVVPAKSVIPDIPKRFHLWYNQDKILAGSSRKGHFIRLAHGQGELFFWLDRNRYISQSSERCFLLFHILSLIVLFGAYLYIRRVMQPIRWLNAAMEQFSAGNLAYRMPLKRHDEFQNLAESMNSMASQIQALIQSKEELLIDVSHELRSPMTRIKVGLEMLADTDIKLSLQEDLNEMETMVTEMLEGYRLQRVADHLAIETISSRSLIETAAAEFSEFSPSIEIISAEDLELKADPKKARVVLRNVLENAVKYSDETSIPIEIRGAKKDRIFKITIIDYGIGIPQDFQKRVFEPFFRVDPSRSRQTGGFGLGLSMCKAIMEAHKGSIEIAGHKRAGTKVTICFPL